MTNDADADSTNTEAIEVDSAGAAPDQADPGGAEPGDEQVEATEVVTKPVATRPPAGEKPPVVEKPVELSKREQPEPKGAGKKSAAKASTGKTGAAKASAGKASAAEASTAKTVAARVSAAKTSAADEATAEVTTAKVTAAEAATVVKAKPGKIADPGKSRGVTVTGRGVGVIVAFLVAVLVVAGFGVVFVKWQNDRDKLAAFDDSKATAAKFLETYVEVVSSPNLSADLVNARLVPLTTGPLRNGLINEVDQTMEFFNVTGIGQLEMVVASTAVESFTADTARVIVGVDMSGASTVAPKGAVASTISELSLRKVDGTWRVEAITGFFSGLRADPSQTGDSGAAPEQGAPAGGQGAPTGEPGAPAGQPAP